VVNRSSFIKTHVCLLPEWVPVEKWVGFIKTHSCLLPEWVPVVDRSSFIKTHVCLLPEWVPSAKRPDTVKTHACALPDRLAGEGLHCPTNTLVSMVGHQSRRCGKIQQDGGGVLAGRGSQPWGGSRTSSWGRTAGGGIYAGMNQTLAGSHSGRRLHSRRVVALNRRLAS